MLKKELVGTKITLRLLAPEYFKDYHEMFSPTVRKILLMPEAATEEQTIEFLSKKVKELENAQNFFYCIFDNEDKKLIGAIEIRQPEYKNGQLGCWLNENYWGDGRYCEAAKLALKNYFQFSGLEFVNAYVRIDNVRSLKAHQKCGFTIEREFEEDGKKHYEIIAKRETFEN